MNVNTQCLKQARTGITKLINENPDTIEIERKPLISDGFEGLVEDPLGVPVSYSYRCRVSHEKLFPGHLDPSPVGFTSSLARYILVEYDVTIYEGDSFDLIGKEYRIGVVDPLVKFDGVIGYQAPLIEAVKLGGES